MLQTAKGAYKSMEEAAGIYMEKLDPKIYSRGK